MLEGLAQHDALVNELFSRNLMSCLINQSADEGRYVHRAATKALKAIEITASTNRSAVLPLLRGLLGRHGTYPFDQRTKSKTIENILLQSRTEDLEDIVKILELPEVGYVSP
jgi:DNA polymerase phi